MFQLFLSQAQNSAEQHVLLSLCFVVIIDMAIFVGIMLTKSTSGEIKDFRSKSKKIISYISVMCFLMLGSQCMLHGNQVFFSILYLPPSKHALLILFSGKYKNCFRRPFWIQLYSLYSCWLLLIYAPVQRALQRNLAQLSILWIFQTKPLRSFFW